MAVSGSDSRPPSDADLWILAGQSNMQGSAPYTQDYPPIENVWVYDMDGQWGPCVPPMHYLFCARQPAHRLLFLENHDRAILDALHAGGRAATPRTTGPAYFFAKVLRKHLPDHPFALLPCAHGGSSLDQWSPERPGAAGTTLYSAMLEQLRAAGRKPTGVLWYQGESDANPEAAATYRDRLSHWIARLRADLGNPALPVFVVQIGNIAGTLDGTMDEAAWTTVREAQRQLVQNCDSVYLTSAVDLPLCDMIHIDIAGAERIGVRLARLALTHVYRVGACGDSIRLESIETGIHEWRHPLLQFDLPTLLLRFSGVTGTLQSKSLPAGFSVKLDQGAKLDIWRTELNAAGPGTVKLYLNACAQGDHIQVGYGFGLNPYCNIEDDAGMSLPAFGPIERPYPRSTPTKA